MFRNEHYQNFLYLQHVTNCDDYDVEFEFENGIGLAIEIEIEAVM